MHTETNTSYQGVWNFRKGSVFLFNSTQQFLLKGLPAQKNSGLQGLLDTCTAKTKVRYDIYCICYNAIHIFWKSRYYLAVSWSGHCFLICLIRTAPFRLWTTPHLLRTRVRDAIGSSRSIILSQRIEEWLVMVIYLWDSYHNIVERKFACSTLEKKVTITMMCPSKT